jgi:hypothetical protein
VAEEKTRRNAPFFFGFAPAAAVFCFFAAAPPEAGAFRFAVFFASCVQMTSKVWC